MATFSMRYVTALVVALVEAAVAVPSFAAACEKKEYAQYKDEARSTSGQRSLAGEYCLLKIRYDSALKLFALAQQHGHLRDMQQANSDASTCEAEMSKIRTVLTSAKATAALKQIIKCHEQ